MRVHFLSLTKVAALVLISTSAGTALAQACSDASAYTDKRPYTLVVNDKTISTCANPFFATTAEKFVDSLKATNIHNIINNPSLNTATDNLVTSANFNGVLTRLTFDQSSTALKFQIDSLGVNETFNGQNRDASVELLKDYLKNNNVIGKIMNYQAKNSPFSPITGQGGLIPNAVTADFDGSFTDIVTHTSNAKSVEGGGSAGNQIQLNATVGSGKIGDVSTKFLTLPLSYTLRNDVDPRRQLVFQLPITYSEVGKAKSVNGGFGVAYRFPMSDNWTLTPNIKYSVVGSKDLASVASMYSLTLGSAYVMEFKGFDIAIGNMLGIYKTGKFSSGDYAFNPDITTTGMRNGIMLLQPVTVSGTKMSMEYSFIDTRYFGDKPFADNTQEFNITLGTNKSAYSARSYMRGGLGYVRAKESNMVKINIGYWF